MLLFNPKRYDRHHADPRSRELVQKVCEFFEKKGLAAIKVDDQNSTWPQDFLEFVRREQVFATYLTPTGYGAPQSRWDMWRIEEMNEVLAFYGLSYWYAWQVTILGLGPIWMSANKGAKERAAAHLRDGGVFAFGLSEKEHGADLYGTEMTLKPTGEGTYSAQGSKYYIGNGNAAAMVSVFGKIAGSNEYVFFAVDPRRSEYQCHKISTSGVRPAYVAGFDLHAYPVAEQDILARGDLAWDAALNTVNVGKYQLGWASIGICTHALYEALRHAANRRLYGKSVTDFPHVRVLLTEAYARLCAMKLYALRACDYLRAASAEDRRYLLFNPIQKMKVTMEGEAVVELLHQVIAAKGFEQDTYFEMAIRDIGMLPKLEGTVHVNVALVTKFMQNYLFNPQPYPAIKRRDEPVNDDFLFQQGPTKGLGKITFHDYDAAFARLSSPNVGIFRDQVAALKEFLRSAPPSPAQTQNLDYMLQLGELFTMVPYAQLIAENTAFYQPSSALIEQIFKFFVSDFSTLAVRFLCGQEHDAKQAALIPKLIRQPHHDQTGFAAVWQGEVIGLKDAY